MRQAVAIGGQFPNKYSRSSARSAARSCRRHLSAMSRWHDENLPAGDGGNFRHNDRALPGHCCRQFVVIAAGGSIARSICPGPRSGAPRPIRRWREAQDLQATKLVASIDRCRADGFCLASAAVGMAHSQENGARLGGTGRPLFRSVWGNLAPSGKRDRFPRELSLSPLLKPL